MKAVFIGGVESSRRILDAIIKLNLIEISGIVTKEKSSFNSEFFSLATLGTKLKVPTYIDEDDISDYLDDKIGLCSIYKSEIKDFPFPRSSKTLKTLAHLRGSNAGIDAANGFVLIKGII